MWYQFAKITFTVSALLLGTGFVSFPENSETVQAQYIQITAEQAKAALRCPNDASKQFVDDVFTLVSRGQLPESLVISAFQYAYKQPKNQWFYFQKSLELRCEKMGINLQLLIKSLK